MRDYIKLKRSTLHEKSQRILLALPAWTSLSTHITNTAGSRIKDIANTRSTTDDCFYISGNSLELSSSFIGNVLRNQGPVSVRHNLTFNENITYYKQELNKH